MIGYLQGTCRGVTETTVIVDINGVGYEVYATADALGGALDGMPVTYWVHTVAREDALELFGFESLAERSFFRLLLGVSGIGPRGALGILGLGSLAKLQSAIASSDVAYLTKVSGIGKRTAEKLCVELKDRMGQLVIEGAAEASSQDADVLAALVALGYREADAREALRSMPGDVEGTQEQIKVALKYIHS